MVKKFKNGYVELKVVTAVLEEKFKSHRELMEERFKEIKDDFEKGSGRMQNMETEIKMNSKFRDSSKLVIGTIGTIFGAIGGIVIIILNKLFNK